MNARPDFGITEEEIWRVIPSTHGYYEASSLGRIRRAKPGPGTFVGRILLPKLSHKGVDRSTATDTYRHFAACLSLGPHGRLEGNYARFVCMAFHGLPPGPNYDADHIDHDFSNNRPENLRWLPSSVNCRDVQRRGMPEEQQASYDTVIAQRSRARAGHAAARRAAELQAAL